LGVSLRPTRQRRDWPSGESAPVRGRRSGKSSGSRPEDRGVASGVRRCCGRREPWQGHPAPGGTARTERADRSRGIALGGPIPSGTGPAITKGIVLRAVITRSRRAGLRVCPRRRSHCLGGSDYARPCLRARDPWPRGGAPQGVAGIIMSSSGGFYTKGPTPPTGLLDVGRCDAIER